MQFTKGCASLHNAAVDFSVQLSIVCDFAAEVGENIGHFQCCIFHGDLRLEVDGSWHRIYIYIYIYISNTIEDKTHCKDHLYFDQLVGLP